MLVVKISESGGGKLTGGFHSLKGGYSSLMSVPNNTASCTNSGTCNSTNDASCTNSGDCTKATNKDPTKCSNTGTCPASF